MVLCGGVGHVGCWMREVAVGGPVWWFFLLSPLLCPLPALPVGTYKAAGREGERKRRKKRGEEGGTGSESLKWMVKTAHSPSCTSVRLFFLFLRSPARPVGCGWWGVLGRLSLEQWKERKKKHKKKKEKRRRRSENFKLKLKTTHSLSGASLRLFFHFLTGSEVSYRSTSIHGNCTECSSSKETAKHRLWSHRDWSLNAPPNSNME